MSNKLPIDCPSCSSVLIVSELSCEGCKTKISGNFSLPLLLQLSKDHQDFILEFFLASGSLKKMASKIEKSYPTVRNMLDDIIEQIEALNTNS